MDSRDSIHRPLDPCSGCVPIDAEGHGSDARLLGPDGIAMSVNSGPGGTVRRRTRV